MELLSLAPSSCISSREVVDIRCAVRRGDFTGACSLSGMVSSSFGPDTGISSAIDCFLDPRGVEGDEERFWWSVSERPEVEDCWECAR